MQMESFVGGVTGGYEVKPIVKESSSMAPVKPSVSDLEIESVTNWIQNGTDEKTQEDNPRQQGQEKEPARSSMEAAISLLNSQIAKTHCAYAYDEDTKRVSIKVYDDETDELIREVPPEKSLEALKKMWEIAGIIIDEKR